jgi:hypothetical protein
MTKMYRLIDIRPFHPDDLTEIELRTEDTGRSPTDLLAGVVKAYTYLYRDQVMAIVGMLPNNPDCCEIFVFLDRRATRYVREIYYYAEQFLEELQKQYVRIHAAVSRSWHDRAPRFWERLGFECEGCMRKFIDGEDYFIFARVR